MLNISFPEMPTPELWTGGWRTYLSPILKKNSLDILFSCLCKRAMIFGFFHYLVPFIRNDKLILYCHPASNQFGEFSILRLDSGDAPVFGNSYK
jgi:hypothetical protein